MSRPTLETTAISDAETAVLEVLWQQAPLSAQQIHQRITDQQWSLATVKTLINRLLTKGALSHDPSGRQYLYSPLVDRRTFLRSKNDSFLNRFYQGRLGSLVAEFTSQETLNAEEIDEIRAILDAMDPQGADHD